MTRSPSKTPPRFVPTLTEVVQPPPGFFGIAPELDMLSSQHDPVQATARVLLEAGVLEEQIVHRVMQRVDVSLDHRLREAIAAVVQEQTRLVVPRLREEIESVVRQSVYEAVADELAQKGAADAARSEG